MLPHPKINKKSASVGKMAYVIDDHPLVARGIAEFLRSLYFFEQVQASSNAAELWKNIEHSTPQLIVVDFWLPDGAALPLLKQLHEHCPQTALLVMSADDDIAIADKARDAGADGFIHKQEAPEVFAKAVVALMAGKAWFSTAPTLQKNPLQKELSITAQELGLTPRQGEVLAMIMMGLPNKRIAKSLSLTEQTVKEHVSGILNRLGVNNRLAVITKLRGKRLE